MQFLLAVSPSQGCEEGGDGQDKGDLAFEGGIWEVVRGLLEEMAFGRPDLAMPGMVELPWKSFFAGFVRQNENASDLCSTHALGEEAGVEEDSAAHGKAAVSGLAG